MYNFYLAFKMLLIFSYNTLHLKQILSRLTVTYQITKRTCLITIKNLAQHLYHLLRCFLSSLATKRSRYLITIDATLSRWKRKRKMKKPATRSVTMVRNVGPQPPVEFGISFITERSAATLSDLPFRSSSGDNERLGKRRPSRVIDGPEKLKQERES